MSDVHQLEEAMGMARAIGEPQLEAHQLRCLGNVNWRLGDYNASQSYFGQSLNLARAIGDWWSEVHVLTALGGSSRSQLDYTRARAHIELLEVANKLDLPARPGFLQEVPSNREFVAAWEGRLGE